MVQYIQQPAAEEPAEPQAFSKRSRPRTQQEALTPQLKAQCNHPLQHLQARVQAAVHQAPLQAHQALPLQYRQRLLRQRAKHHRRLLLARLRIAQGKSMSVVCLE